MRMLSCDTSLTASSRSAVDVAKNVAVISPWTVNPNVGPQGQKLYACVTADACGAAGLSAGMVVMPPGGLSRPHLHAHTEIIVCCVVGSAVTLIGPELEPFPHGPGEFIYIPEGVIHVAVNRSLTEPLVAIEMRTDPLFNDDVVLLPELEPAAAAAGERVQRGANPARSPGLWNAHGVHLDAVAS